jgi:hypothetical protein
MILYHFFTSVGLKMITYIEKGSGLHNLINKSGYKLKDNTNNEAFDLNGNQSSKIDTEVQAIIDNYNPLPQAQKEQIDLVNTKAGETRTKYVTNIPFQEAAYQAKEADVRRYKANGYPSDLTLYPFVAAEVDATGLSPTQAANDVIIQADQWLMLNAEIERLRRKASVEIGVETDWQQIAVIANNYIQQLDLI